MSALSSRRGLLGFGLAALLPGCGFRPVYMASGDNAGPSADLAAVDVLPMYERPGQVLRLALQERLASDGDKPHKYDLNVSFWISGEAIGVLNFSQYTRVRLIGHAAWKLRGRDPKQTTLTEGSARAMDGYDQFGVQYFAADMDNEFVQRRIAGQVADQIAQSLALWFRAHPGAAG